MASSLTGLIAVGIVVVSCGRPANAQGTEAGEGAEACAIPRPALQVEPPLEPVVREMCRRSLTFRRQLFRVAGAPGLVVTVAVRPLRTSSDAEATTRFAREHGLLSRADVEIGPADLATLVELIAHELEHVLEQLDDVNLTYMAQGPGVRSHPSKRRLAFDTARARQIGLSVAAEFKAGPVAAGKEPLVPPMKTQFGFGVHRLAARLIAQDEEASHATVLRQRAAVHPGPATVDVSADGRYVAFESAAALIPADRNRSVDIYVLDRSTGNVTLESVVTDGIGGDGTKHPRLSGDGRYLVFTLCAPNLADQPMAPVIPQVVLRDRRAGTATLVSRTLAGTPANAPSGHADISDDGATIVFQSSATDLVDGGDRNGLRSDVYAFDVRSHRIERVSVDENGEQPAAGSSFAPTVSGDGRYVVFVSSVPLDGVSDRRRSTREAEGVRHVYLRNLHSGVIRRISRAPAAGEADGPSFHAAVSRDGRLVAFVSEATNLVPRDRNRVADVYVHDVHDGHTMLVSRSARGGSATGPSHHPALSADGRFVAFVSEASDLDCANWCPNHLPDLNLVADVYVFDTLTHAVARVSGARARSPWWEVSAGPSLDAAGRVIAFSSRHPIDPGDLKHDFDLFIEEIPVVDERTDPSGTLRPR